MSDLISTTRLYELGWTAAAVKSLLGPADDTVQVRRGAWFLKKHLYERARVTAAMERPEFLAIALRRKAKAEAPARRRAQFEAFYADHRAAFADAAKGLHALNRYAKWRECSLEHRTEIYDLKNRFVELLYREGHCTACWIHQQVLPPKLCRECGGDSPKWTDDWCERCANSGEYLPAKTLHFYCFQFAVGRGYTWHQPDKLVRFPVSVTEPPKQWEGVIKEKPLSMPRTEFARAKELLRWVLDRSAGAPPVEPVTYLEAPIPPVVDLRQASLF